MAERWRQNDGSRDVLREFLFIVLPPSFCNSERIKRDALLPKLLSGEIRVAEAERLVEEAG